MDDLHVGNLCIAGVPDYVHVVSGPTGYVLAIKQISIMANLVLAVKKLSVYSVYVNAFSTLAILLQ